MKSSYQKFTKDIIVIGIANSLVVLSGLILLPLLTKTLGAHDYGIWVQAQVTISLITIVAMLNLPYAMMRFLAAKKDKREIQEGFYSAILSVFLTTVVASSILIGLTPFLANNFFDGATDIVKLVGFIIPVWTIESVCLMLFRTFRQMKTYAAFTILRTCAEVGLICYMVISGFGISGALISILIVRGTFFLITFGYIISRIGLRIPNFSKLKSYLKFGLPLVAEDASSWVVSSSDRYVIAYFLGTTFVGFYSPGYSIGAILRVPIWMLTLVLVPTLSKLYDEGRIEEVKVHLRYSLKYLLMITIPFVFAAGLLSKQILVILSTPEIASQGYLVMPIVALSTLLFGVYTIMAKTFILTKKTKFIGMIWIISAAVNLLLNILVVPHIGILGAAITTLIAYTIAFAITAYFGIKHLRFPIEWRFIGKSIIAAMVMSLSIFIANPAQIFEVVIWIVGGAAIYFCVLSLLRGFKKEEIRFFRGLFRRA